MDLDGSLISRGTQFFYCISFFKCCVIEFYKNPTKFTYAPNKVVSKLGMLD
jgi:hypothetical protein